MTVAYITDVCFIVMLNRYVRWRALREIKKQEVETKRLILNDVISHLCKATVAAGSVVVWLLCGPKLV